ADEAVAVRVNAYPDAARHARAFGVRDAGIEAARSVLGTQCDRRGRIDVEVRGKVQLEIARRLGHELGVGQTRILVSRGKTADAERFAHRIFDARVGEIGGARAALAALLIHRNGETAV